MPQRRSVVRAKLPLLRGWFVSCLPNRAAQIVDGWTWRMVGFAICLLAKTLAACSRVALPKPYEAEDGLLEFGCSPNIERVLIR